MDIYYRDKNEAKIRGKIKKDKGTVKNFVLHSNNKCDSIFFNKF